MIEAKVTHYPNKKALPDKSCVFPVAGRDWQVPRPGSQPLGTYGNKRRYVYREMDMSQLRSATEWRRSGFVVLRDADAVDVRFWRYGSYCVYGDWQVRPTQPRCPTPAEDFGDKDILRALWTINRYAKRCRDAASSQYQYRNHGFAKHLKRQKEDVYSHKSLVLAVCLRLTLIECTGTTEGEPRFAVFHGGDYCFHSPCGKWPTPNREVPFDGEVEAKPKEASEMRLKDAWATIKGFLLRHEPQEEDIEMAETAQLPPRPRYSAADWEFDEDDECEDDWEEDRDEDW